MTGEVDRLQRAIHASASRFLFHALDRLFLCEVIARLEGAVSLEPKLHAVAREAQIPAGLRDVPRRGEIRQELLFLDRGRVRAHTMLDFPNDF